MGKVLDYQDSVEKMRFRGTVWKRCVSVSAHKIWSAQISTLTSCVKCQLCG